MYIIFISYIVKTQIRHRVYLRGSCTLSPGCTNVNEHKTTRHTCDIVTSNFLLPFKDRT